MSENNANQEQEKDGQDRQDGGKSNSLLEYLFYPYEGGVGFQVVKQHEAITEFLKQQVGRAYRASNGVLITLCLPWRNPEWQESINTICLDGTGNQEPKTPDITYFQTKWRDNGKVVRDRKMNMFRNALSEFVDLVKITFSSELRYDRLKRNRQGMRIMLA